MPFYEYECENCKFYAEVLQKISDPPLLKCPSCGKNKMKKLISAPVFRLKGGGWYETDFKSDNENKRNLAVEKDADSASDSKSESKAPDTVAAEAKSDAKPDSAAATPSAAKRPESKAAESRAGASKGARKSASSKARPAAKPKPKAKSRPAPARGKKRR